MILKDNDIPKSSLVLFGLYKNFELLVDLYELKKFPKILMLTGEKGLGKFTLLSHFLHSIFDKKNYDVKNKIINDKSEFHTQYISNIYPSIIYLSGEIFNNIRIENIRELKSVILKKNIIEKDRFIILDDIELFNINSLNALLKIIEEPTANNYFFLINNKTKPLIKTIFSRSIEIKVLLSEQIKKEIIKSLVKINNQEILIDINLFNLTPGNFLLFNKICGERDIDINGDYLDNLKILFDLYKKNKNINFIKMSVFLTDVYFNNIIKKKKINIEKTIQNKDFVLNNINNFILYNLNQNSLINAINNKLSYG